MQVTEKKENFIKLAVGENEKVVIADGKGQIAVSFISPNDCILMLYRKTEIEALQYV